MACILQVKFSNSFLYENGRSFIQIPLKFVPDDLININQGLVKKWLDTEQTNDVAVWWWIYLRHSIWMSSNCVGGKSRGERTEAQWCFYSSIEHD